MFGFLKKTVDVIKDIAPSKSEYIEADILEDILLEADVSYECVEKILEELPRKIKKEPLEKVLLGFFDDISSDFDFDSSPFVDLVVGVNGAGKTTTIAKLANFYKKQNNSVMLGASDTFRAAAIEQLTLWANKLGISIVSTSQGHDPSAVAYDTISSAVAKGIDHAIIDTAGRLHTQSNLANELKKIVRVIDKAKSGAPNRKILILDGTQGNSAITQAKAFDEMIGLDALIITKLDGTAKGGAIFSIVDELKLPVLFIGSGESEDDLEVFDSVQYVRSITDTIYGKDV